MKQGQAALGLAIGAMVAELQTPVPTKGVLLTLNYCSM